VPEDKLMAKIRALLAKAESTEFPGEAEALTAKAADWMAKYGIEQALLDSTRPAADNKPMDRKFVIPAPYATVKSGLLYGVSTAMGCTGVRLQGRGDGVILHIFGFRSDIERADLLFTSLLLQMAHGLAQQEIPERVKKDWSGRSRVKAYRRSWMLGFTSAAIARVRQAENQAKQEAEQDTCKPGTALVLADRSLQVQRAFKTAYPRTTTSRSSYSGSGYGAGYAKGQQANIGGTSVGRRSAGALR
jgi:hypothetical protein